MSTLVAPVSVSIAAAAAVAMSGTATWAAPSLAKRRQSAAPMPSAPPVTTITLPFSSIRWSSTRVLMLGGEG